MNYKVGEKTVESKVGAIRCHHIQNHWGRQEWDTFYDKNTGLLIDLKETIQVGRYTVTYTQSIIDTNAHLSIATDGEASDYTTLFILIAVLAIVIAIIVSASFLTLRRRRKSNLNVEEETVKRFIYPNLLPIRSVAKENF
jgi:hypothetical protein